MDRATSGQHSCGFSPTKYERHQATTAPGQAAIFNDEQIGRQQGRRPYVCST